MVNSDLFSKYNKTRKSFHEKYTHVKKLWLALVLSRHITVKNLGSQFERHFNCGTQLVEKMSPEF